jgi:hypothetical protein
MKNMAAVAPYSGAMFEMVARSPMVSRGTFAVELQVGADDLLLAQEFGQGQHHVGGGDARLALPVSLTPTISGRRIHEARPSITFSASRPPTPMAITPSASTCGVCESVPTQVSGKATPLCVVDHRRHLLQVDLVHDAVARRDHVHVLEGLLGPVDEVEAVFVAAIFDARFFSKACGSKPPHSTASEWSTISCTGTTGLTLAGSPPCSAIASRRPARSTSAVWPRMSWQTTRAGNHGKSRSRLRSISLLQAS